MKLSSHRYGKARVRVVKILREGARHTVVEADVQVLLEGDVETSYTKGDNNHSFTAPGSPVPWVKAVVTAKDEQLSSGVTDWLILKSTESGFSDYPRCEFTTLPETNDRIFATSVTAGWHWTKHPAGFRAANEKIRAAMIRPFCDNFSPSVQATMAEMAEAAFAAVPEIDEVSLALPNKHCNLINLAPFGLDNPNVVFTATDEPHGQIEAVFRR